MKHILLIALLCAGCEAKVKLEVKADTNSSEGITITNRPPSDIVDEIGEGVQQLIKERDLLITNVSQPICSFASGELNVYSYGKLTNVVIDSSYKGTIKIVDSPAFSLQWQTIDHPAHIDQSDTNHPAIVFTTNAESMLLFTIQGPDKWWSTKTIFQRTNN